MTHVNDGRSFAPQSGASTFQALLNHLHAEHYRVVDELQAEIARLHMKPKSDEDALRCTAGICADGGFIAPTPHEGSALYPSGIGREAKGGPGVYGSPMTYAVYRESDEEARYIANTDCEARLSSVPQGMPLPKVLEWGPTEFAESQKMARPYTLPAPGSSRWRRLQKGIDAVDLPALLRMTAHAAALKERPDNSALSAAYAAAQAFEEEDAASMSSASVPIWDEGPHARLSCDLENDDGTSTPPVKCDSNLQIINSSAQKVARVVSSDWQVLGSSGGSSQTLGFKSTVHLHAEWKKVLDSPPVNFHDDSAADCMELRNMEELASPTSKKQLKRGGKVLSKGFSKNLSRAASRVWKLDESCMDSIVLHPNNKWRVTWDLIGFALLLWDVTTIPMQIFALGTDGFTGSYSDFLKVVSWSSTIFWTVDLFVNCITGYYSAQGYLRTEFKKVFQRYLKTWFVMDLFLAITDWLTLMVGMFSGSDFMRIGKTLSRFMRIVRLLRFVKLSSALQDMLDRINSEYIVTLVGVAKILVFIIIMNHYIACGWYGLSQIPGVVKTWLDRALLDTPHEHENILYMYFTSLHWSLTQFTPASMEVVPQNAYERSYNVVIIVIGVVAFSSFVSSITGAMTYVRIMNSRKMEQNACLRRFFAERNVSQDLACRVWHWSQNTRSARIFKESDVQVLDFLPDRTRRDLRYELHAPVLQAHPLFFHYHCIDVASFRQLCDAATTELSVSPGQIVFEESKYVDRMFFVLYGTVDYHQSRSHSNSKMRMERRISTRTMEALKQVQAGEWACEVALWVNGAKMTGEFAGGLSNLYGAELMIMTFTDFLEVAKANPRSMIYLAQYAELFCAECMDRQVPRGPPIVFNNDLDQLQEMAQRALDMLICSREHDSMFDAAQTMVQQAKSASPKPRLTWISSISHMTGHDRRSSKAASLRPSLRSNDS